MLPAPPVTRTVLLENQVDVFRTERSIMRRFATLEAKGRIAVTIWHKKTIYVLSCNWKPKIHRDTCLSGSDHNQISLWIIGSDYGKFNDLAFYSAKRRKVKWSLEKRVSKSFSASLSCMIKVFMDSSNVKFVINSTLRVSSITNFSIGFVHEYTSKTPFGRWTGGCE